MAIVYYNGQQYNVPDDQAYSILKQTKQLKPSNAGMPTNVQAGTAAAKPTATNIAVAKSSAGMPTNVQAGTSTAKPTATNTAAKSSAGMPTNVQAGTATAKPAVTNTATAKPAVTNTATAKPTATNIATAKPAVTNTATAKPTATANTATANTATANTATANTAGVDTATANTAGVDTAATQPVINDFDLNLYDKYAADRIKKKFNKIGKADQYQPFINDFYGSDTMDDNRYNELMNKYELGNTFKNDFDLGKSNYKETYDIARRNKVNTENKAKKQEEKQAKADANEEQRVKSQVADMLKKATPYELTQFMVGQGPIYETIAKYSKYFG